MFESMKRTEIINKEFYVRTYAISLALFLIPLLLQAVLALIMVTGSVGRETYETLMKLSGYIGVFTVLTGFTFLIIIYPIFQLILLFKMWSNIQDENARTTPGKAVGFLFIPFFSIYWVFNVWSGFATDYNRYIERNNLSYASRLSSALYFIFPLFAVLSSFLLSLVWNFAFSVRYDLHVKLAVLVSGLLIFLNFFIFLALIAKTCNALNVLNKVE